MKLLVPAILETQLKNRCDLPPSLRLCAHQIIVAPDLDLQRSKRRHHHPTQFRPVHRHGSHPFDSVDLMQTDLVGVPQFRVHIQGFYFGGNPIHCQITNRTINPVDRGLAADPLRQNEPLDLPMQIQQYEHLAAFRLEN